MLNFKTLHLSSETGSTAIVEFYPEYEIIEQTKINRTNDISVGGQYNTHIGQGLNYRYTINFTYANSSEKYILENWWDNRTSLRVTFNGSYDTSWGVTGKIVNIEKPFSIFSEMSDDHWKGFIRIAQNDGNDSIISGFPFILDDVVYGKLDQSYNKLT